MAKKRASKEPKFETNPGKIILTIVLVVIILLLIFLYKTPKTPENKIICGNGACEDNETHANCPQDCLLSPCEQHNYTCYPGGCPLGYAEVDLSCNAIDSDVACCKKIENQTNCTGKGQMRHPPMPDCCSGLKEVGCGLPGEELLCGVWVCVDCGNGICEDHENWGNCKEDCKKSIIYGFVKLKQGNCMPPIGPDCKDDYIATQVAVFPKVSQSSMDGSYYRTTVGPINMINSNITNHILGYYQFELQPGQYSVFAKDPNTGDYYCNSFDGQGNACYINLTNTATSFDITIDHSTQ